MVQTTELLIKDPSPLPTLISFGSKPSPLDSVFKYLQPAFPPPSI